MPCNPKKRQKNSFSNARKISFDNSTFQNKRMHSFEAIPDNFNKYCLNPPHLCGRICGTIVLGFGIFLPHPDISHVVLAAAPQQTIKHSPDQDPHLPTKFLNDCRMPL